ncbi:putative phage protein (TIGR01671 family) [Virgibacillus natechei]|uniref:Phage protein (TIGR01671 family) n=1 Tax=Virgibacillus natechei TaxID=1216297 RepID=A0ABS4IL02_9BACI|nr:YopX family protein [Virgibacillus natechei]MBP1971611.1 putative phage protein (TIGR01671 family) [Virgibacillus natechei]UZD13060.1 YopX family protein [Virgibacillus natechei]
MRKIKFRAWDKATKNGWIPKPIKQMIYFNVYCPPEYLGVTYDEEGTWKRRFEIMQYTGLKDQVGEAIYEGDILYRTVIISLIGSDMPKRTVGEYLEVVFRDDYAGFFIGETPLHGYVGATVDIHTKCKCTDVEVIGNIYENPELLEDNT